MTESNRNKNGRHEHPGQLGLFSGRSKDPKEQSLPVANAPTAAERCIRSPAADRKPSNQGLKESESSLLDRLSSKVSTPLRSLTLTRNRTRIVSARPDSSGGGAGLDIRIHRCFAEADDRIVQAVADFLEARTDASRKRGLQVIREHFRDHGQDDTHRPLALRPNGACFDLAMLRDRVNREYFSGSLSVEITWSQGSKGRVWRLEKRPSRKGSFSIRLGSYDERLRLVRIHPVLDRKEVPEFVVESIVYHEMLHAVIPPKAGARRRSVHPPEFRRLEKLYARFDEAEAWLDANVERLARLR